VARWDWVEPRHGVVRQKNNSTFFLRRLFLPRRQLPIARFAVVAASIAADGFSFREGSLARELRALLVRRVQSISTGEAMFRCRRDGLESPRTAETSLTKRNHFLREDAPIIR
jgi:hypothetical protein